MILMTDESEYDRHGGLSHVILESNEEIRREFVVFPKIASKGLPALVQSTGLRHEYCVSCLAL